MGRGGFALFGFSMLASPEATDGRRLGAFERAEDRDYALTVRRHSPGEVPSVAEGRERRAADVLRQP
jgi:hypothetical protein